MINGVKDKRIIIKQISKTKTSIYINKNKIGHVYVSNTGYIYDLYIKKEYRNQTYGTILMQEVIKKGGFWLHIEEPNMGAKRFYKKFGFKEIQTSNYLKLYVKSDKLKYFYTLIIKTSIKKILGTLSNIKKEIDDYNNNPKIRTIYDKNGYQIK